MRCDVLVARGFWASLWGNSSVVRSPRQRLGLRQGWGAPSHIDQASALEGAADAKHTLGIFEAVLAGNTPLDIIHSGVDEWNKWRQSDDGLLPYLRNADLRNLKLQRADFTQAALEGADFSGSDLSLSDFSASPLTSAKFKCAFLVGARFCDFYNLAVKTDSGLILRCPLAAPIDDVDLEGAILFRTSFIDLDLSSAKNLDTCIHWGPSNLDSGTLLKSTSLPVAFLRGCGLPESFITGLPAARRFASCFISYSSKDESFAIKLHDDVQE